jgi:glycosyltransferase involved in cell wall biosynthesis|tara:strand:+ start:3632 stop:4549 length:918 start_codon:yes stop_codon:yes gene_type:complete
MKIIIQIPCFNEEGQLKKIISEIKASVDQSLYNYKIVIIDDGSTDNTVKIANENNVDKIISFKRNMGLGYAFEQGINFAKSEQADILIHTDADNQYQSKYIPKLIESIKNLDVDIVVGVREFDKIDHFSWSKKILQKIGSKVVRIISGQKISDASSGFRAYSKKAIHNLQINSNYTYTLETLIQAKEKDLIINEIPIEINLPTRKSRLFNSTTEFVVKQMLIIFKAFLLHKPLHFFSTLAALPFLFGNLAIFRFIYFYIIDNGDGYIQSLILGVALLLLGVLLFFMGLLGYLIKDIKKTLQTIKH